MEDDARIARFVAKGLREQSYAVDVAGSGEEALYQAAINSYDLAILDVMMPASRWLHGLQGTTEIRAAHAHPDADRSRRGR